MANSSTINETGPDTQNQRDALNMIFAPIVADFLNAELPKLRLDSLDDLKAFIAEQLNQLPPLRIEIVEHDKVLAKISRQHYLFPLVIKLLRLQDLSGKPVNLALVGPTGTGKTTMGINAAKALEKKFVLQPFNPQTTKSELLGYMDATGKYVPSPFYNAFKLGQLFIADEFDAANPAVATVLNAAISNRIMTFPNGETLSAHTDFHCIYCMNTYGTGGDDSYTGRSRLDMATLDRMVQLYIPIDPGFEAALVGISDIPSPKIDIEEGGHYKDEREILNEVISLRGALEKEKLKYSMSPRVTIHSCALHRAGIGKRWIKDICIWRNIPEDQRNRLTEVSKIAA